MLLLEEIMNQANYTYSALPLVDSLSWNLQEFAKKFVCSKYHMRGLDGIIMFFD